jgi:putative transposase
VRFRFIEDHRDAWPVRVLCDVLGASASGYSAWRGRREVPVHTYYVSREAARRDLFAYIETYYNRRRLHSLGYRTPEQAELHAA